MSYPAAKTMGYHKVNHSIGTKVREPNPIMGIKGGIFILSGEDKYSKRIKFIISIAFYALICGIIFLIYKFGISYFLPFIIAFSLVSIVNPITRRINAGLKKSNPVVGVAIIGFLYIVVGLLLFFLVLALISLSVEAAMFIQKISTESLLPSFNIIWNALLTYINDLPQLWRDTITDAQSSLISQFKDWGVSLVPAIIAWLGNLTKQVPTFLITFMFTIMLSFFVGIYYERILIFVKSQLSLKTTNVIIELRNIIKDTVVKYLGAILILMSITFVELSIGLYVLGVANPIGIAAVIAILDALPIFGTGAAMIPWCLVSLIQGNYSLAGGLIIVYVIVTVIRNVLEPKIVGDRLGINPIISITAMFLGFKVFQGFMGMIIMPMIVQIVLELERRGTINLFKKPIAGVDEVSDGDGVLDSINTEGEAATLNVKKTSNQGGKKKKKK